MQSEAFHTHSTVRYESPYTSDRNVLDVLNLWSEWDEQKKILWSILDNTLYERASVRVFNRQPDDWTNENVSAHSINWYMLLICLFYCAVPCSSNFLCCFYISRLSNESMGKFNYIQTENSLQTISHTLEYHIFSIHSQAFGLVSAAFFFLLAPCWVFCHSFRLTCSLYHTHCMCVWIANVVW